MQDKSTVISLENVSKTFQKVNRHKTIRDWILRSNKTKFSDQLLALNNVNLKIKDGEIFGIIGRNGSGKSTLLNIIMGTLMPDKGGKVDSKGKIIRLSLGLGVDPNLSARDNIYVNGTVLGLSFKEIGSKFDSIISFAGIEDFIDNPVKHFSKGMKQRLLFSIAIHAKSDIFLLDEFFGGTGDKDFRKKSDDAFKEKILEGNTIVIVSHSMSTIKNYCARTLWLNKGSVEMIGPTEDVLKAYEKSFVPNKKKVNALI